MNLEEGHEAIFRGLADGYFGERRAALAEAALEHRLQHLAASAT
jgi:hypothetical protein